MFGQPEWFAGKTCGRGVRPACWKGWIYSLVWMLVVAVPTLGLLAARGVPEAAVWLCVAAVAWFWNTRQIAHAVHCRRDPKEDDVLYISDQGDADSVTTKKYELHLKR